MAWLRRLRAWLHRGNPLRCVDCGTSLTDEERTYYGCTCEDCEARAYDRWSEA